MRASDQDPEPGPRPRNAAACGPETSCTTSGRSAGGIGRRLSLMLVAGLMLTACVTPTTERTKLDASAVEHERAYQRQLVIRRELEYRQRLTAVSYPLLRAATPLCVNDLGRGVGLAFANVWAYAPEYREAAAAVLGLDERVRIIQVLPGSASAAAGLMVGDVLTGINGVEIGSGRFSARAARRALDEAARSGGAIELEIDARGHARNVSITPDPTCYYPVRLLDEDVVNAYADGEAIYVTRGMMRFAADDESLALVIAHELAHNAMAHVEAQRTNRMMGRLVDLAAKAYGVDTRGAFTTVAMRSRSESFEAEADYVALYVLALAGQPYDEAADFWRQMAIEHPESIEDGYLATHPSTAERYVAIDNGVREIRAKHDAGEPLLPNHRRFVSRFKRAPLAFRMQDQLQLDTRSGRPVDLPSGCWRRVGETRYGMAYIPERGTLKIHGDRAALILDQAEARGLWKIQRARFLALDEPLEMDPVAEPLFECVPAATAPASRPVTAGEAPAGVPAGMLRRLPD